MGYRSPAGFLGKNGGLCREQTHMGGRLIDLGELGVDVVSLTCARQRRAESSCRCGGCLVSRKKKEASKATGRLVYVPFFQWFLGEISLF